MVMLIEVYGYLIRSRNAATKAVVEIILRGLFPHHRFLRPRHPRSKSHIFRSLSRNSRYVRNLYNSNNSIIIILCFGSGDNGNV